MGMFKVDDTVFCKSETSVRLIVKNEPDQELSPATRCGSGINLYFLLREDREGQPASPRGLEVHKYSLSSWNGLFSSKMALTWMPARRKLYSYLNAQIRSSKVGEPAHT